MAESDAEEKVRELWSAYGRGGVDAVREQVDGDVDWRPLSAGDDAERIFPVLHGLETHGGCVLARGSLRTFREGGFVDVQPSWTYFFREGRLIRVTGFMTRSEALEAIAEFNAAG